jgi:hypothetical protein
MYDDLLAVRRAGAIARPFLQSLMKIQMYSRALTLPG